MQWKELTLLITGGTGSFGNKLVEILLAKYFPKKIIILSRDELKQYEMMERFRHPSVQFVLGDVRDQNRLLEAFTNVDLVMHAAALKQVPRCESEPNEAIKTNILGAINVITAAGARGASKVVALSTDKACQPANLYGATKLCSDRLFAAANGDQTKTQFSVVRYGNVFNSRGSVVPFFREKGKAGVLPITDERMTRFWITLEQGAEFVLSAFDRMLGGEIFVPKLPSMRIVDLAEALVPGCQYEIIGIRPGEKIHESLISQDEARNTVEYDTYYVILPSSRPSPKVGFQEVEEENARLVPEGFSYRSDNNPQQLTIRDLQDLSKQA